MSSSVYSEVIEVSGLGHERDRVLDKLRKPSINLPYTIEDIRISHNDFATSDVYNDSLRKLYSNYLYLIANAEITTNTSPTTADFGFISLDDSFTPTLCTILTDPALDRTPSGTAKLSATKETHITKKTDNSDYFLYFNYSPNDSVVFESDTAFNNLVSILSGNEVEFNKTFKFEDVISVDSVDNLLFVLDRGLNTVFKFDVTGLITNDPALKRNSITDTTHPGRYLIKTIGGEGISQTKNKLNSPRGLSLYKNRLYILDNGHMSLKVFDLDFNFITEIKDPSKFNNQNIGELVSIVVDQKTDNITTPAGYILSSRGNIIQYDTINNTLSEPFSPWEFYDVKLNTLSAYDETASFKKIVNSKSTKNILYLCNNKNIYKFYKTNLTLPITVLDLEGAANITIADNNLSAQKILSFDTALHNGADYVAVTTSVLASAASASYVSTYMFGDKNESTKLYNESLYTNYYSLSDILVLPQEIVNNITFNKTTQKLIYNHYSLFENINKKVYSFYNTALGSAAVPTLCTVNHHEFTTPDSFSSIDNAYIGVNEPLLTDVVNRPLEVLYNQQEDLFNIIKEESLNLDPPSNLPTRLPGKFETPTNIVSITPSTTSVTAGDQFTITATRTNDISANNSCSYFFYTTLGTALSSDLTYIPIDNKSIGTFQNNILEDTSIKIQTEKFFSGAVKTFSIIIQPAVNCVVDPQQSKIDVTVTPVGNLYTVSLSDTTLSLNEGESGRLTVTRTNDNEDYSQETSVNIKLVNVQALPGDYTPNITGAETPLVVNSKFADFATTFPGQTNGHQVSAKEVGSTSTIFFTENVSSVVFDINATYNLTDDSNNATLLAKISNPSDGSIISRAEQYITINEPRKTISLFLSSISGLYRADGTSNDMLSCVNVWEALRTSHAETSAGHLSNTNAFSAVSATHPVDVTFTVNKPLTVFSVSAVSGALGFVPGDMVYSSNTLTFVIEGTGGTGYESNIGEGNGEAALVGKGGAGGSGGVWLSGYSLDDDNMNPEPMVNSGVSASWPSGEIDGGSAIGHFDNYFSHGITISNSGAIYGGAGGGGAGVLGVSALSMPGISSLSASCGGGGGAGVHLQNTGPAGLAALRDALSDGDDETIVQDTNYYHVFVANGNIGSTAAGGIGGAFTNHGSSPYTSTYPVIPLTGPFTNPPWTVTGAEDNEVNVSKYPAMAGLNGGAIGEAGGTDATVVPPTDGVAGSFTTDLSVDYKLRTGGEAGLIIDSALQVVSAGSTGVFKGTTLVNGESNIVVV